MVPLKLEEGDRTTAVMRDVKRETDYAVMEERQIWIWAPKARRKGVNERPTNDALAARKNVAQNNVAARSG